MAAAIEIEDLDRRPVISWGAVIAGLFFVMAAAWLLFLLGSAIGVSVADLTDMNAIGRGLGWGTAAWIVLVEIAVYFLGGMITARLAAGAYPVDGVMHGLALWSTATVLMLVLGAWGVGNMVQSGQSLISGAAGLAGDDSPLMAQIQARIKRDVGEAIARTAPATQGADITTEEAQRAVEAVDAETVRSVARQLLLGNEESAKAVLAAGTGLSQQQVDAVIAGVAQEASEQVEQLSTYTQAALWALFVALLLSLIAALIGGRLGSRPRYPVVERRQF